MAAKEQSNIEQTQAQVERERQGKMQAIERAERAKAEAKRQIEQILEQAQAAGSNIDI